MRVEKRAHKMTLLYGWEWRRAHEMTVPHGLEWRRAHEMTVPYVWEWRREVSPGEGLEDPQVNNYSPPGT